MQLTNFPHRRLIGAAALACAAALIPAGAAAATSGSPVSPASPAHPVTAYVANGNGTRVTPINTATNRAGTPIVVGSRPGQIAITPNGKTAYVLAGGSVVPINTRTGTALKPIKGTAGAGYIAITPNGKTAYVSYCETALICGVGGTENRLTPIDTATNTALKPITWQPGTAWEDSPIVITPNGKTVYIASTAGTVTPVSTATGKAGKPIKLGHEAENGNAYIAITPNGKTVYVTESGPYGPGDTVTPISTATNKAGKPIKVGQFPAAIGITPNGKTVYVASTGSGPTGCIVQADCGPRPDGARAASSGPATVTPISTATNKPGKAIKIGPTGSSITLAITPNSKRAYVLYDSGKAPYGGYVTPIRTATNTAFRPIAIGSGLNSIAITPNGKTAYVSQDRFTSKGRSLLGFVIPIRISTNTAFKPILVGHDPGAIVITP